MWFTKAMSTLLLVFLLACTQEPASILRIGTNVWPGYEPLYLAREMGLTDKYNIKLLEFSSASQTLQAFRNEVIDAAALTLDEVFLLLQSGEELELIFIMDVSHGGDAIIAQPNILNMNDMEGKLFGVENNALGAYVLSRALNISKLIEDNIHVTSIPVNEQKEAFIQKKVDAIVVFEPVLSEIQKLGGRIIFDSRKIPGEILDVMVVRRSYLKKNRGKIEELKKIWFQAIRNIENNPNETMPIIAKRLRLTPQQTVKAFQGLKLVNEKENKKWLLGGAPKLLNNAKSLMDVMIDKALIEGSVDYSSLIKDDD